MRTSGSSEARAVARTQVGQGTPYYQDHQTCSTGGNQDGIVLSRVLSRAVAMEKVGRGTTFHQASQANNPRHDTIGIEILDKGYHHDSDMEDDKDTFGHEAVGTSPLFSGKTIPGRSNQDSALANATQESLSSSQENQVRHVQTLGDANLSQQVQFQSGNNERADGIAISPPKTGRSSLRTSRFAPVILPSPLHANAVDVDPDFFKGVALPGSGPGPHFITVLFI